MSRLFLAVPAPAKLNLFLHVVGQRGDGYHELQSVFIPIDIADLLDFERRADGKIERTGDVIGDVGTDLAVRAAQALQQASGTRYGVSINVEKKIPAGSGMGGGSSDAASTLIALNRLWDLAWPRERLFPLAVALGADVPFFSGRRASVRRRHWRPVERPCARARLLRRCSSASCCFDARNLHRSRFDPRHESHHNRRLFCGAGNSLRAAFRRQRS